MGWKSKRALQRIWIQKLAVSSCSHVTTLERYKDELAGFFSWETDNVDKNCSKQKDLWGHALNLSCDELWTTVQCRWWCCFFDYVFLEMKWKYWSQRKVIWRYIVTPAAFLLFGRLSEQEHLRVLYQIPKTRVCDFVVSKLLINSLY